MRIITADIMEVSGAELNQYLDGFEPDKFYSIFSDGAIYRHREMMPMIQPSKVTESIYFQLRGRA